MTAPEADRLARVTLAWLGEPGKASLLRLVRDLGASGALEHVRAEGTAEEHLAQADPARELELAGRRGVRFVVPGDEEWPVGLDDLAAAGEVGVHGGVPLGLWVRGPLRLDELHGSLAVVGSRSATTYGDGLAREVASAVAEAGRPIVSGAAYGIDQAAHRGALAVDGATVAVLACGADRVYPPRHRDLIEYIAVHGAVVSETFPDGAPMRQRFLARNRLIAALGAGTVVVEAALRSGALNTANWASRLNRHLMGMPGPVTSGASGGVHQLIRTGAATLVTSGAEALELLGSAGEHLVEPARGEARPRDGLSELQLRVLDAVPVVRGATSVSIAAVARASPGDTHATLVGLELRGLVEVEQGAWRLSVLASG